MLQESSTVCSCTTFNHLPPDVQHLIFASAAAPLTTCKASAAIAQDPSLVATWLLVKHKYPLVQAAKHQLWGACEQLLGTHQYKPGSEELQFALSITARRGSTTVAGKLLQLCCIEPYVEGCAACFTVATALLDAASWGNAPVASLILQHPSITAQHVRSAVCTAAGQGHSQVLELLMDSCPEAANPQLNGAPMNKAAASGQRQAMQLLMQHGADINGKSGTPWSCAWSGQQHFEAPLHDAALTADAATVGWMLEHGADASAPLEAAASRGDLATVRLLLQGGADVSAQGRRAMRAALEWGHAEAAQLLLAAGTPDYFLDSIGVYHVILCLCRISPDQASVLLQTAVQHGHVGFAKMLQGVYLSIQALSSNVQ
jgi:ankyrin repeat protein